MWLLTLVRFSVVNVVSGYHLNSIHIDKTAFFLVFKLMFLLQK